VSKLPGRLRRRPGLEQGSRTRPWNRLAERSGDAYADATTDEAPERSRRVFPHAATEIGSQMGGAALSESLGRQTFVTVLAAFALGWCFEDRSYLKVADDRGLAAAVAVEGPRRGPSVMLKQRSQALA
jgi:hypothetical protein